MVAKSYLLLRIESKRGQTKETWNHDNAACSCAVPVDRRHSTSIRAGDTVSIGIRGTVVAAEGARGITSATRYRRGRTLRQIATWLTCICKQKPTITVDFETDIKAGFCFVKTLESSAKCYLYRPLQISECNHNWLIRSPSLLWARVPGLR